MRRCCVLGFPDVLVWSNDFGVAACGVPSAGRAQLVRGRWERPTHDAQALGCDLGPGDGPPRLAQRAPRRSQSPQRFVDVAVDVEVLDDEPSGYAELPGGPEASSPRLR